MKKPFQSEAKESPPIPNAGLVGEEHLALLINRNGFVLRVMIERGELPKTVETDGSGLVWRVSDLEKHFSEWLKRAAQERAVLKAKGR